MEKNTRTKNILLIVLLVAVLTLSISYAFLSQTLTITNMSTTVKAGGWNVKFTSATCSANGSAAIVSQFNGGTIVEEEILQGLSADFNAPGDSVTCAITVENLGTINAILDSFVLGDSNLTFHSTLRDDPNFDENDSDQVAAATADETLLSSALRYTLVYAQGDDYAGQTPGTNFTLQNGDDYDTANGIPSLTSRHFTLKIEYVDDPLNAQSLPENDVVISGFNAVFTYKQA